MDNPDLGLLPRQDRVIIRRALNPDYRQRFETNTEMIEALASAARHALPPPAPPPLIAARTQFGVQTRLLACHTLEQFVHELVKLVAGNAPRRVNWPCASLSSRAGTCKRRSSWPACQTDSRASTIFAGNGTQKRSAGKIA